MSQFLGSYSDHLRSRWPAFRVLLRFPHSDTGISLELVQEYEFYPREFLVADCIERATTSALVDIVYFDYSLKPTDNQHGLSKN